MMKNQNIVLENEMFTLTVGRNCIVKSLIIKATGEECLHCGEDISLFSVTQERPFNNEVKLSHPNCRTTYHGNSLRRDGDRLIVGFEIAPYEAVVTVKEAAQYISFELVDFILSPESYPDLCMTAPPAVEFCLLRIPVKNRTNFGEWMNVSWDERAAINVLGISPYTKIGSERRKGYRLLTAESVKSLKLKGCPTALIAAPTNRFLDAVESLEEDYDLPRGVASRRNHPTINSSEFWTACLTPDNVDEHIAYAQKGGFRLMLIYYTAFIKEEGYFFCGDYDYLPSYKNGREDLKMVLARLKSAGITPGLHILQTHIGLKSRYVTPTVDYRINLKREFTLSRPLLEDSTEVYVAQNPTDSEMHPACRYLTFGGEMISYEAFTTEPPYKFTGCKRGQYNTSISSHPTGLRGGILDISEFGAMSAYVDQTTDLQDEIADKIADIYSMGFEFVYFDGSEGTNIPYGIHIPSAQYRVYKKLSPSPLFTEGAAKAHFGWHHQSGGNAFDVFPPEKFKRAIDRHPLEEAPRMRQDFSRINFGWWNLCLPSEETMGTQADLFEYGTSKAASWDCPAAIQMDLNNLKRHPRTDDILEVMRRWEDVRRKNWLTEEQKLMLREPGKEFHLLINEQWEYELVPYEQIKTPFRELRAFLFQRNDTRYVAFWHISGSGKMKLSLSPDDYIVKKDMGDEMLHIKDHIPVEGLCYLSSHLPREAIINAFETAELL